ncbi:DUF4331 domain-containing protein [Granulosicoccus antarcticus]|uniref:DUF4331 domain-containing protein n=1 Tax=Granulosicoccus antarcticus IMCC3135 TaxID=1192854 RepID=A0A2Z2NIG7_9GAMM|nr:DUF4331 domain-containing protein [Granulosicoccus antarcticus]ASJ70275.1 hypothetical protein IMCC3135_00745 [Granulosicoccus antarcticus IMCC3135]
MKNQMPIKHYLAIAIPLLVGAVATPVLASSHREAPYVTQKPKVDATDFYLFNSYESGREGYVTLVANYVPLQDPYGGPNYFSMDPNALYEINVDNDGDAVGDISFQFRFQQALAGGTGVQLPIGDKMVTIPLQIAGGVSASSQAAANFSETYSLEMVAGDSRTGERSSATDTASSESSFAKPLDFIGDKTFSGQQGYSDYVAALHNSGSAYNDITLSACPSGAQDARVFVGQRTESFSVNLGQVFDLVNFDPTSIEDNDSNNQLADKNITTIALEVSKDCLTGAGNGVIGGWTAASEQQIRVLNPSASFDRAEIVAGAWTQVSRLGAPLVNEVVIGLGDKNRFNASQPADDGQFADYVTNPTLPALLNIIFNSNQEFGVADIAPQNFPRTDLVAAFLTGFEGVNQLATVTPSEMLRLNTAIAATAADAQSNLGVAAGDLAGFPNGRRPGDDVTDLALRVVMGALCHNIAVDLNGDGNLDDADNLNVCGGDSAEANEASAPAGAVAFRDGAPQNAAQFDTSFPYLRTPVSGSTASN